MLFSQSFYEEIMDFDKDLYNATVIAENPEMVFLVEGDHLHPVEPSVGKLKHASLETVLPLMRNALKKLAIFAQGKVPPHFTDMEKNVSLKAHEKDQIIEKIGNIYHHLPHHDRNDLSTLIHHKLKK